MTTDLTAGVEVVADGLVFAEGPRWRDGHLVFSEMHANRVVSIDQSGGPGDGRLTTLATFEQACSGIGWLPDSSMLVVTMQDRQVMRVTADAVEVHADLAALTEHEINDMVVSADGHAYVSQLGYSLHTGGRPSPSPLLVITPEGKPSAGTPDLQVANGVAITPDGTTLVVAESSGCRLTAFTLLDGQPVDQRVYAELPPMGYPDGMCLDEAGAAWVACPVGGRFIRVLPGGEVTHEIVMPDGRHAIACVLGGADRRTLYLCTAVTLGGPDESRATRGARIERVRVEVAGAGIP